MTEKTILVIEDESVLRNLTKRILEKAGYRVICAEDGERGLESIESNRPEVVLLDLNMPGMGGLEVLRALKERGIEQKVVVVSGSIDGRAQEEAESLGAADYVRKPFFLEDLLGAVARQATLPASPV